MNFAKIEMINEKEIPEGWRQPIDYTPLFRKIAAMVEKEDALRLPIEKAHYTTNIQAAIDKEFGKGKYKTMQRTIDKQLYCIIVQK